ncbi:hypothetical protein [Nostoc sp.]|uniref:hypothetical protein n=1 Tax=Nostoc sp. TaxID=1180 RepID=UPI002FFB7798
MKLTILGLIPFLDEGAPNYMRNEPQRTQRAQRKKERRSKGNLAQFHKEMVLRIDKKAKMVGMLFKAFN